MSTMRCLAIVSLTIFIGACGSKKFETIERDASLARDEVTIGILPINYLDKPSVEIISNPVVFVPRVGTLIVAKGKDTKRRKFASALREMEYFYEQRLDVALTDALRDDGFEVRRLDIKRTPHRQAGRVLDRRFEKTYPEDVEDDIDVILDAYVDFVGYSARSLTDDYLPTFFFAVRLVDADSHEILYQNRFLYNAEEDPEVAAATIEADTGYTFASFDALIEDMPKARDGLDAAIVAIANRVATELE